MFLKCTENQQVFYVQNTSLVVRSNDMISVELESPTIRNQTSKETIVSFTTSKASSLEAFSCNPTHDSVSALTCRSTEITGYVNQRFLSYCDGLLLEWILSVG